MSEPVRVGTGGYRAAIGLLILASTFHSGFANGQCSEPVNPKAEVPSPHLAPGLVAKATVLPGQAPVTLMMYKPRMTVVPDLSNKKLDEVSAEVVNKLYIQTVNNNNTGWIVERQFPVPYSNVVVCSALQLWMKMPPQQMTKIPPIVGVPEGRIPSLLVDYHLKYGGSAPKETTAAEPGTIFDQDPEPGTPEPWGSEVIAYKAASPPQVEPLSVTLTADKTNVAPGDTITFVAMLQPDSPDAQYAYDFGNGSLPMTGGPEVSYPFEKDGDYDVRVTARVGERKAQSEQPVHITVHETKIEITVSWEPLHPVPGQPVTFTARVTPDDPSIANGPYYFYFGDKAKPKASGDVYTQAFAKTGTYPVTVTMMAGHGHTIKNDPQKLVVVEPQPTWWEKWGKYVTGGVIVVMCSLAGLYLASKYVTGLVDLHPGGRPGSVDLHHDGEDALEAAFGFRIEQPVATATAEFRRTVILRVERIG